MTTSEKTLTIRFISQPDITSLFSLNADFDQAPKKTKATAADHDGRAKDSDTCDHQILMDSCGRRRNIWDQDFLGFRFKRHEVWRRASWMPRSRTPARGSERPFNKTFEEV